MQRRQFAFSAVAALALASASPALAASPPTTWDNLVKVKSKRLNYVYLLPGADFRAYSKVMLDPTQIAFKKNWQRDYNSTTRGLSGRVNDSDIEKAITQGGQAASEIFNQAFADGGYPVVTEPGPDVLRVRTAVINLSVSAPDTRSAGRSRTYSNEAGSATLVVEVADSVSGAILGRAVDSRVAGDYSYMINLSSMTNRSDFAMVAKTWAKQCVGGLDELKRLSPVSAAASA
jgi:Protein of unknown function (DUF3313)